MCFEIKHKCMCFFSPQISHLQRVLEAAVAVPALWEVQFIIFMLRIETDVSRKTLLTQPAEPLFRYLAAGSRCAG